MKRKRYLLSLTLLIIATSLLCPTASSLGQDAKYFNSQGVALTKNGTYTEALTYYDQAIATNPDYYEALDNKVSTLFMMGKYEDAAKVNDALLKRYPSSSTTLFKKGLILSAIGDHENALISYDMSLESLEKGNNLDHESGFDIGSLMLAKEDNAEELESVAFDSREATIWYHKARSLEALGMFNESLSSYDKVIGMSSDYVNKLHERAFRMYEGGRYDKALVTYDLTLGMEPANAVLWYEKGLVYDAMEDHENASYCYSRVTELDPNNKDAFRNMAQVQEKLNNSELAIQYYDQLLSIDPYDTEAWYGMGRNFEETGNYQYALKAYDQVLAYESQNKEVWSRKGILLDKLGRYDEAIQAYDRALQLDEDNPDKESNTVSVSTIFASSISAMPVYGENPQFSYESSLLWYNKGLAFDRLARYEDAVDAYD
ncbi:MAG: tetratricopeptide repeat protein, partial [Methanolobus sp.]|nr:tetratricopeptide repeat protein [Methanolobus sp.]